jgi:outer membrane lipoprotein-sorting protein
VWAFHDHGLMSTLRGIVNPMRSLLWALLLTGSLQAQIAPDATELLQKAKSFGESTRTWRAEAVQTLQVSGPGLKMRSEDVHIKLAAQAPSKMSRVNSGDDRTTTVCDGTQQFYSADGLSYYLRADGQCSFPLLSFYEPSLMNFIGPTSNSASVSVVGEDHVRLTDGERRCVVVRVVLVRESMHAVRTMCIDPTQPVILRDVVEIENGANGFRSTTTTTFLSFESKPTFAPDTFRITIPPGAYAAH